MTSDSLGPTYVAMLYVLAERFDHLSEQQVAAALDLMSHIDPRMLQAAQAFVSRVLAAESRDDIDAIKTAGMDIFGIDCDRKRMN